MSKSVKLANILMFMLLAAGDVIYILTDNILAKAVTSSLFVILGVLNAISVIRKTTQNKKFVYLMIAGLFFAFLGDVVLEIQFCIGAALFAVGHILFFTSYLCLKKFSWKDLIPGVILFVPCLLLIVLAPIFDFGGILLEVVAIVYALIISLMLGKAISNVIRKQSALTWLLAIGSFLFFFSDLMLLFSVFGGIRLCGILCLATYYPAEAILAFAVLFAKDKSAKDTKQDQNTNQNA